MIKMDGRYYYDPGAHVIKEIWGMPADIVAIIFLFIIFFVIFSISTADWWKCKYATYKYNRKLKKRIKAGKGKIKSFIVEIAGRDMTRNKFTHLTSDVNAILAGNVIKGVGTPKTLDANNVVGITNLTGMNCHFFVIWYREV